MTRITLTPIMDRSAVTAYLDELKAAFAGTGPIEIACEAVEQIGLAGLQLLACAVRTGRERGTGVVLSGTGDTLLATARLAGMEQILFPADGASS
ncbi:STAS domain-containing protein [Rhizorhabdus argentea]|uniref:STAS domain-containing protein n=1 Tax=Rhizorhabdus argentea TaxID=1387174 RepID=UPI0030EC8AE6